MVNASVRRLRPEPYAITPRSRCSSAGDDLDAFAGRLRVALYPWQLAVVMVALERLRGRWRYPLVTVSVPRQSGKTLLMAVLCLFRCWMQPDAQVWYTAQSRMDGVLRWREIVRLLRRSELVELTGAPRVAPPDGWDFRVRGATGAEVIEFRNGSQLRVFAPAEDSLHGSVTDLVVLDEARFFDQQRGAALMAAVLPTQATRDGQVWIVSTAGGPGSTFLAAQLDAGRVAAAQRGTRRAHAEWSIGDAAIGSGDLLDTVWNAHPAAGLKGGPRRDALAVAADSMPAWQFAHEYGNRWQQSEDLRLLPGVAWARSIAVEPIGDGVPVFGADVALDRSSAAIVTCVDGVCQLVECAARVDWLGPRLLELAGTWDGSLIVLDAAGPAGNVAAELTPLLGERLLTTGTRDLAAACGGFYDALLADEPLVWHRPSETLDDAAARASRRRVGQSWVFDRVESGPALLAMVLAYWGATASTAALDEPGVF